MQSIDMLIKRRSQGALVAPAPEKHDVDLILKAGMNVPDHACLTPWHFTLANSNEALTSLSRIFESAARINGADEAKILKTAKMPFRAPLIIIVTTRYTEHPKVPEKEQLVAAGCAVHAMQMAAFSLGYGAMWRTGELSYDKQVKRELNIKESDDIVGFLYIGTPAKEYSEKPEKDVNRFSTYL